MKRFFSHILKRLFELQWGCGSPVVKASDPDRHVMCSSPVSIKRRRCRRKSPGGVEQRVTLQVRSIVTGKEARRSRSVDERLYLLMDDFETSVESFVPWEDCENSFKESFWSKSDEAAQLKQDGFKIEPLIPLLRF
ncbi:hypothetical protein TNCV_4095271 [Trichonephila clavipes]|uniref:Uncharacterized protein n=1 Tax=Trichonephila clavipes TaxID=2585209 RepID=A0A8X6V7F1_TRICX|nr:hypothetical protein TNCV_4095271 [Trichonephila clavipes]